MKYIGENTIRATLLTVLALSLIAAGMFLFRGKDAPTAEAGWWNDNWSYRKQIVINSDYVTGNLTDFPVLVSLTDTSLGAHAQADGDDIVFIDSEGNKLSHEIESFTTITSGPIATGTLVAWVKIPNLSSTDDTPIYMYYGNAGVGSQEQAEAVWDENYIIKDLPEFFHHDKCSLFKLLKANSGLISFIHLKCFSGQEAFPI